MPERSKPQLEIYDDPYGPKFEGQYAPDPIQDPQTITVASYNVNDSLEIEQTIRELGMYYPLRDADFFLLQEMDEEGTERIARELQYNYLYYPTTMPARIARNFGNAILSRWPLSQPHKLILPRKHPTNKQLRTATRATAALPDREVTLYSVHTETYTVLTKHRKEQVEAIANDIGNGESPVIVGGDFNTVSGRSIRRLKRLFGEVGLVRASAGSGTTVKKYKTRPSAADHIFARGFEIKGRGTLYEALASDHLPVWVELIL